MVRKKKGYRTKKCKVCSKQFYGQNRRVTCSRRCALKYRSRTRKN